MGIECTGTLVSGVPSPSRRRHLCRHSSEDEEGRTDHPLVVAVTRLFALEAMKHSETERCIADFDIG